MLSLFPVSSMAKIFPGQRELDETVITEHKMLKNERYSFQAAYRYDREDPIGFDRFQAEVVTDLPCPVTVRGVEAVPCRTPVYEDFDEPVLRREPGLFPDILEPIPPEGLTLHNHEFNSLWITIAPQGELAPGDYTLKLIMRHAAGGECLGELVCPVKVLDASLPKQKLIYTNWMHYDGIAQRHGLAMFSEAYWAMLRKYVETAARYGMNMILTPLFTPALDTAVGGERMTAQLVDVTVENGGYRFGFDKLERFADMCLECGIRYFEMCHLFTQWGARHAPKIMAETGGGLTRIFGWETDAAEGEYPRFLEAFLPALIAFWRRKGLADRVYFHISDEPNMGTKESYAKAAAVALPLLEGFPVMDALSDYSIYEEGLVKTPVCSTDHIQDFLRHGVQGLWAYYCCGQYRKTANRFLAFPGARNRAIGMQLYAADVEGFLHWGFNFYNSGLSAAPVDPYRVTDAGGFYPGGDGFVVYPGPDGPVASSRLEVFYEGLQDLRLLRLAEEKCGRQAVMSVLGGVTFTHCPYDEGWLLSVRERLHGIICA